MHQETASASELLIRIDERTATTAKRVETIENKLDGVVYRRDIEPFMPRHEIVAADAAITERVTKLEKALIWAVVGIITTFGGMLANLFHLKLSG